MSDRATRERNASVPVPHFADPAFTRPPPLEQATVAIVTTAGLQRPTEAPWRPRDTSYRVFGRDEVDLTCSHTSLNFDRSGLVADLDVVYPLTRLKEMEAEGTIKAVAPRHLSFLGSLPSERAEALRGGVGAEAARLLRDDGVDVVLLTPI